MPPVRDATPAGAPPKRDGSVGLGVLLAFAWMIGSFVLTGALSGVSYRFGAGAGLASQALGSIVVFGSLVAIHVYAVTRRRTRLLAGFWGAVAIGVLVFVVSCFAIVWAAFH
jgi:asparagine N-glycosylation enzyme membrane subunit Stt3